MIVTRINHCERIKSFLFRTFIKRTVKARLISRNACPSQKKLLFHNHLYVGRRNTFIIIIIVVAFRRFPVFLKRRLDTNYKSLGKIDFFFFKLKYNLLLLNKCRQICIVHVFAVFLALSSYKITSTQYNYFRQSLSMSK